MGDLVWFLRAFVLLLGPFVALLTIESVTGNNPFFIVGGGFSTTWNDGVRIRCNGSFAHPSLLGTLGASFLPLYIGLALTRATRVRALVGIALCMAVVLIAGSSGPVLFVAVAVAAWGLWTMRRRMFAIRWGIVVVFVLLALVMKVPVWYLPQKLSPLAGGGDGWHRSELMNKAIENIDQWWLAGMALDLTADWFFYRAGGAVDLTNAYLTFGFDAGLLAIALFILLLVRAFRSLGLALETVRRSSRVAGQTEFLLWGLGAVLTGHIANLFATIYWDQTYAIWLMQLATIASVAQGGARYSALTHRQDTRWFVPRHDAGDGVQIVPEGRQAVAPVMGRALSDGGHGWCGLQGWSARRTGRRMSPVSTTIDQTVRKRSQARDAGAGCRLELVGRKASRVRRGQETEQDIGDRHETGP